MINMEVQPGRFWFKSLRKIGEGGLGIVDVVEVTDSYYAYPIGTRLARKRLNSQWASEPGAQQRFEREIEMLGKMRHPNIVALAGVSLPDGDRSYFMPYYPSSLRAELNKGTSFPLSRIASLGTTITQALGYAHGLGYTHRDIKPDNILMDAGGNAIVSDWGLGQFIHKHSKVLNLTRGGPMGTEYYCSLEQWASGKGGIPGDVYSLGMTLAELALGAPAPLQLPGMGIQKDVVTAKTAAGRAFNALIRKMTSMAPAERHASMGEVGAALVQVTGLLPFG